MKIKITKRKIKDILVKRKEGFTVGELSWMFNLTISQIDRILTKNKYNRP